MTTAALITAVILLIGYALIAMARKSRKQDLITRKQQNETNRI
jgi:hypothetical protein